MPRPWNKLEKGINSNNKFPNRAYKRRVDHVMMEKDGNETRTTSAKEDATQACKLPTYRQAGVLLCFCCGHWMQRNDTAREPQWCRILGSASSTSVVESRWCCFGDQSLCFIRSPGSRNLKARRRPDSGQRLPPVPVPVPVPVS